MASCAGVYRSTLVISRCRFNTAFSVTRKALPFHPNDGMGNARRNSTAAGFRHMAHGAGIHGPALVVSRHRLDTVGTVTGQTLGLDPNDGVGNRRNTACRLLGRLDRFFSRFGSFLSWLLSRGR